MKLGALGLSDRPADFEPLSFIEAFEGEVINFLPRGFEKLHFLDGVLWLLVGVVDFKERCFDGVLNTGTSDGTVRSTSLSSRLAAV